MPRQLRTSLGGARCWLLVLILLFGFCLRLVRLHDKEMWYDEAFAVLYAEKDLNAIIRGTVTPVEGAAADIHPLLYYFFLHIWMHIGQSPVIVRFPSVVFGLLSICFVFLIARELFDQQVALLAAALAAISPFHIWYSQETRMYSLLCVASLLSIYLFAKAYKKGRWLYWIGFGLSTGVSLYAHNLAFLILFAVDLFVLLRRRWNLLGRLAVAHLVSLLVFLPWLLLAPGQFAKVRQAYWVAKPGLSELVRTLIVFTFNLPVPSWLLPLVLFYSMLLLTLTLYLPFRPSVRHPANGSRWAMWLILSLSLVPVLTMFVISQLKSVYIERAVLVSALAYYTAMAYSVLKARPPRLVLLSLLPVPLLLAVSLGYQYTYSLFPRSPFRDANAYLREHRQPGDVIVHDNKLSFFPSHYYDRSLPQAYIGDAPGSPTDTLALPTQQVLGLLAQPDIAHAVDGAQRVRFVIFQRSLDEAAQLGVENASKVWLDDEYRLTHAEAFNDLLVYLYEAP
jgi:mannosyltransferase